METLNGKSLHGPLWKTIENQNAVRESWLCLKDGRIASNTEATLVMTIQDGVMWTRNYQKAIGLQGVVDKCRLCGGPKKTLQIRRVKYCWDLWLNRAMMIVPELSILKLVGTLDYSRNHTDGGKDKLSMRFVEWGVDGFMGSYF